MLENEDRAAGFPSAHITCTCLYHVRATHANPEADIPVYLIMLLNLKSNSTALDYIGIGCVRIPLSPSNLLRTEHDSKLPNHVALHATLPVIALLVSSLMEA